MTSSESLFEPLVDGTFPGVIDSSQRERLLRTPSTILCFATFHPLTAHVSNDKKNGVDSYPHTGSRGGKRIVVETDTNTGVSTWRFVPPAKMDLGIDDEGRWPRVIQLCGRVVRMTQDQWDIHKLDTEYDCVVRAPPVLTSITRRSPATDILENPPSNPAHDPVQGTPPNKYTTMEGMSPTPRTSLGETPKATSSNLQSPNQMTVNTDASNHYCHFEASQRTPKVPGEKRPRGTSIHRVKPNGSQAAASSPIESFSSLLGSDVESGPTKKTRVHDPSHAQRDLSMRRLERERKRKAELDTRLKARRDALQKAFWDELGILFDLRNAILRSENNNTKPDNGPENSFEEMSETTAEDDNEDDEATIQSTIEESRRKLAELERDRPPREEAVRRRKEEELREEEERKQNKIRREEEERRRAEIEKSRRKLAELEQDRPLWEEAARRRKEKELREEEERKQNKIRREEEERRRAEIEESRRKLAALEQDKPLWEEAARRRKKQELREEEERKRNKIRRENQRQEAERQRQEVERQRQEVERRRAAYRRYREQRELEQKAHEREMKKLQKGSQMFIFSARGIGAHGWTIGHALKRCLETASRFDSAQYTTSNPLDFKAIPWPIFAASFTANDIQWQAVEMFLKMAYSHLPVNEFRDFVDRSHKRFHPDRWRSRRILLSVQDDLERDLLEVAGNTVAQVLTPLWKKVTGRV